MLVFFAWNQIIWHTLKYRTGTSSLLDCQICNRRHTCSTEQHQLLTAHVACTPADASVQWKKKDAAATDNNTPTLCLCSSSSEGQGLRWNISPYGKGQTNKIFQAIPVLANFLECLSCYLGRLMIGTVLIQIPSTLCLGNLDFWQCFLKDNLTQLLKWFSRITQCV
jgi:hypothetical protein